MDLTVKYRPALIVDPDWAFLSAMKKSASTSVPSPLVAPDGKAAQAILGNPEQHVAGVFVNLALKAAGGIPGGISVVKFVHLRRPGLPIYAIHDGNPDVDGEDLRRLGVQASLSKPVDLAHLMSLVNPVTRFDGEQAVGAGRGTSEAIESELKADDQEFVPVRAADFVSGSKSFFDVYVRLSSGRYVKLLRAGDAFSPERVSGYLRKGVEKFYIPRSAQQHYLSFCDQLATKIVNSPKADTRTKTTMTLHQGDQVMGFLRTNGLSEANLSYVRSYVDNVRTVVRELDDRQEIVKSYLANIAAYEHGVATSMIACMVAKQLEIESETSTRVVGVAAMLHDIGLYRMPPEIHAEDEASMSDEQRGLYRTHPTMGAMILKNMRGMDPVICQAVAQHHERRTHQGFPARLGAGKINRVAEIIGISDEFLRFLLKNPDVDPPETMYTGFSAAVAEAFRAAFFPNKKRKAG